MYPLNMTGPGFAVANNEDEHKRLTEMGYGPAFVAAEAEAEPEGQAEPVKRGPGRPRKTE